MMRWHRHRHACIQADVAGQEELVEVARCHVAGDDRANVVTRHTGAGQRLARCFDALESVGEMWPNAPQ
jgi:hypothetical protein